MSGRKLEHFNRSLTIFFYQHPQPLYEFMRKEIDNLEMLQGVNFEFINSLKNNGTKYLLIFDTHVQNFATARSVRTMLLLADFADLVLFTLKTTYSTKVY